MGMRRLIQDLFAKMPAFGKCYTTVLVVAVSLVIFCAVQTPDAQEHNTEKTPAEIFQELKNLQKRCEINEICLKKKRNS